MKLSDFDYELPPELIAHHPADRRDDARLFAVDRTSGSRRHLHFRDLPTLLRPGDALVLNETKVRLARLRGHRESGGRVECLLVAPRADGGWEAMVRPGRRLKEGERVRVGDDAFLHIEALLEEGRRHVFVRNGAGSAIDPESVAYPALPPYIDRDPVPEDVERYQTVFAAEPGAIAAPTAGLHFTEDLLASIERAGVDVVKLVLHAGAGTFKSVETDDVRDHVMESERYRLTPDASARLRAVRESGGRIVAVGTTSTRVLESVGPDLRPSEGETNLFIHPPYEFRVVDALITNFHLPRSTLLLLVSAFAGRETILDAYAEAVAKEYRFFSYGDAMIFL